MASNICIQAQVWGNLNLSFFLYAGITPREYSGIIRFFSHQKEIGDYKIFENFAETEVPGFVDHVHVMK